MTQTLDRTFDLSLSADAVRDAMRDPALIETSERSREALDVQITQLAQDDRAHSYEIEVENYARGVKGIDRSKTERSRTTVRWDLAQRVRRWTWKGAHAQVEITGEDRVEPAGEGKARLHMTASISVGIPLVGKVVEKKIAAGFEENWPDYIRLVEAHVRG